MKELLKFITCGSVDDGKSTLIGHMLYDAKLIYTDQEQSLIMDSKVGSRDGGIDYSLLLDGLMAEREQGITIDVAYRYFTTEKRSFIVADTPGHEEYTRNMAVGASFADLAVILVDATKGILQQTRRHSRICALMGIKHFVFAVNKMDLVRYDQKRFRDIESEIRDIARDLSLAEHVTIPVSATEGGNVTDRSTIMTWYKGPSLLQYLEAVDIKEEKEEGFVFPVQRVCRPNSKFRGYAGEIESGRVSVGDTVTVLPSREEAVVTKILNTDKDTDTASRGMPVTICIDREVDISRGCFLIKDTKLFIGTSFTANILWMDDAPLVENRSYLLKLGTQKLPASVTRIRYKIDVNSGQKIPADNVFKNEIACCEITLSRRAVFDRFDSHRVTGEFILIDRVSNMTSACGTVMENLQKSQNIIKQDLSITRGIRSEMMGHRPVTVWFTGLSGSGKSVLANATEQVLASGGRHTMLLDGDNIRLGINKDLGFSDRDRVENIRRIAEIARLMNDAGLIVLVSFISPFRSDRERAREIIGAENVIEVYVNTPLEVCEQRDVKGLYKRARAGEIQDFTGISSPYEAPQSPDLSVDTSAVSIEEGVEKIMEKITGKISL